MTRRIRVGGACAAIICLAAALLLAVVLPGHGASASEKGKHCDDDTQHGTLRSRAVSAANHHHRSEHPGKGNCVPTSVPAPTTTGASPIPESAPPPSRGHVPPPQPTTFGGGPTPTGTASPSATPSESGSGTAVPNSVPPGRQKHSSLPAPTSPASPSTPTSAPPTARTSATVTHAQPANSSTPTPRAAPSTALPSVGQNAGGVSHSAGEGNSSLGNATPTGPAESPGPSSTSTGRQGDGSQPPGTAGNPGSNHSTAEQAAKNAAKSGADDSVLLAVLVLGFAVAVSGVVIVAGRRGGRRVP
jgi:hypothetical protein